MNGRLLRAVGLGFLLIAVVAAVMGLTTMTAHAAPCAPGTHVTTCAIGECPNAVDLDYDDHHVLRNGEVGCLEAGHPAEDVVRHGASYALPARPELPPLELPLRLDERAGVVDRNGNPVGMYRPEICAVVVEHFNSKLAEDCD